MAALIRVGLVLFAFLIMGCASANRLPTDYSGPDAGYLIVALGASPDMKLSSYTLFFQKKTDNLQGRIHYQQYGFFKGDERDFDDQMGNGIVNIQKLPPGEYEIFNFNAYLNQGSIQQSNWSSKSPFAIPFRIEPGVATYIGDFMAVRIDGKNIIGMKVLAGIYFVISDKRARDLSIAQRKEPQINNVQMAVPNVEEINHPLIRAKKEQDK